MVSVTQIYDEIEELKKELSLEDMVGRYSTKEPIDSVKLKHDFKNGKI